MDQGPYSSSTPGERRLKNFTRDGKQRKPLLCQVSLAFFFAFFKHSRFRWVRVALFGRKASWEPVPNQWPLWKSALFLQSLCAQEALWGTKNLPTGFPECPSLGFFENPIGRWWASKTGKSCSHPAHQGSSYFFPEDWPSLWSHQSKVDHEPRQFYSRATEALEEDWRQVAWLLFSARRDWTPHVKIWAWISRIRCQRTKWFIWGKKGHLFPSLPF